MRTGRRRGQLRARRPATERGDNAVLLLLDVKGWLAVRRMEVPEGLNHASARKTREGGRVVKVEAGVARAMEEAVEAVLGGGEVSVSCLGRQDGAATRGWAARRAASASCWTCTRRCPRSPRTATPVAGRSGRCGRRSGRTATASERRRWPTTLVVAGWIAFSARQQVRATARNSALQTKSIISTPTPIQEHHLDAGPGSSTRPLRAPHQEQHPHQRALPCDSTKQRALSHPAPSRPPAPQQESRDGHDQGTPRLPRP